MYLYLFLPKSLTTDNNSFIQVAVAIDIMVLLLQTPFISPIIFSVWNLRIIVRQ